MVIFYIRLKARILEAFYVFYFCQNRLKKFTEKKIEYESYITFTDVEKSKSDIETGRLILFKREYLTLIENAYKLLLLQKLQYGQKWHVVVCLW